MNSLPGVAFTLSLAFAVNVSAQSGLVDPTFDPGDGPQPVPQLGFVDIFAVAVGADGKILVSGQFSDWNNAGHATMVRLLPDGTLDRSFSYTSVDQVYGITPQGRKLLIDIPALRRLNEDGSPDATFNPFDGFGFTRLAPDGTILRAGTQPNSSFPYLSRLSADGLLDQTFHVQVGVSRFDRIRDMVVQPDGRIVIVGQFPSINGTSAPNFARLNPNGALDTNFVLGAASIPTTATDIELDARGGFYVADASRITHVFSNGMPDTNFVFEPVNFTPSPMVVQTDNKLIVGVGTSTFGPAAHLRRYNVDGRQDLTFGVGFTNDTDYVQKLALLPDGRLMAAGRFTNVQGTVRNHIARLLGDAPVLAAARVAQGLRMEWPAAYANALLQGRTDAGAGAWQNVSVTANVTNGVKRVVVPATGNRFFRLLK